MNRLPGRAAPFARLRALGLFGVAGLAGLSLPAGAQTPAPSPPPAERKAADSPAGNNKKPDQSVDKVEVTASQSAYDARQDDTATKIVVTAEEIKRFGDTQVLDVLKRLPGVTVVGNSIRLRGLGNGYTQILLDGEKPPPGFQIDNLNPDLIEKIEIIRAATAEFSTQAVAGTVNIVLKKRVTHSQRDLNLGYYQGTGYVGQNVNVQIAESLGKFSFQVGLYAGKNDNDFKGHSEMLGFDPAGQKNLQRESEFRSEGGTKYGGVFSNLLWNFGNGDSLNMRPSVNAYRYDNRSIGKTDYLLGDTTPYPVFRNRFNGGGNSFNYNTNLILKLAEGAKIDIKLSAGIGDRDNDQVIRSFDNLGAPTLVRDTLGPTKDNNVNFSGKYSTPIVEGHSLVGGWDVGLNNNKSSTDINETSVTNPPVDSLEEYRARVKKYAFFAQDEWNVLPNWSVYFGLRWEGIETRGSGNAIATVTNRSSVTSPLFQTLWKFPDKSGRQLRFALTRTYKAPDTLTLIPRVFRSAVNTATTPDYVTGNASLRPELANGVDLAYEHFWAKGASMSISGTLRNITDYNSRATLFENGRWINKPVNKGDATSKSLEFDAKFPMQTLYEAAPPVDFRFNAARNFSNVESVPGPNNRLDQQVKYNATIGADYRMRGGMVVAGTSYTYRAGGDTRTSVEETRNASAKRDLDAYILYKYTPKLQFRLRMANILRKDEVQTNTFIDSSGRSLTANYRPTAMNIGASVEVKF